ncbi:hypothetical protein GDO81_002494 [Engystomops pustulosus]|uniref:Uncharacterized protein n=1 Tax=Engystomops pustulosus TaxID=76066 RepID=A0AAV7DKQ1_ENGPU|nr:hypothetical protein GDO81_002494 [Engystomops pustulosus]
MHNLVVLLIKPSKHRIRKQSTTNKHLSGYTLPFIKQAAHTVLCWTVMFCLGKLEFVSFFDSKPVLGISRLVFGDLTSLSSLATSFKSPRTNSKSSTIILICSFTLALEACPSVGEDVPLDFADMLQSKLKGASEEGDWLQPSLRSCSPAFSCSGLPHSPLFLLPVYTLP